MGTYSLIKSSLLNKYATIVDSDVPEKETLIDTISEHVTNIKRDPLKENYLIFEFYGDILSTPYTIDIRKTLNKAREITKDNFNLLLHKWKESDGKIKPNQNIFASQKVAINDLNNSYDHQMSNLSSHEEETDKNELEGRKSEAVHQFQSLVRDFLNSKNNLRLSKEEMITLINNLSENGTSNQSNVVEPYTNDNLPF